MGILDLTPDSFYDGGMHTSPRRYILHCEQMIQDGAEIIDIGALSTRPGSHPVSVIEEKKRLLQPLKNIRKTFPNVILSIDTYRSEIARLAHGEGADIINDISGGKIDEAMFTTVAELKVPYILMHMQGRPENMQENPQYEDVIWEIKDFFKMRILELQNLGHKKIILDPGFGFGKSLVQNYQLLGRVGEFKDLGFPLLAGVSRKSMINKILNISPELALNGTTVIHTVALLHGISILRAHDVREAMDTIRLISFLKENM